MPLSRFYLDLLDLLLDGDAEGIFFRHHMHLLRVSSHIYTGVSVWVTLSYTENISVPRYHKDVGVLDGVTIYSASVPLSASASLHYKNGLIECIEILGHGSEYPKKQLTSYTLVQDWVGSPHRRIKRNQLSYKLITILKKMFPFIEK